MYSWISNSTSIITQIQYIVSQFEVGKIGQDSISVGKPLDSPCTSRRRR